MGFCQAGQSPREQGRRLPPVPFLEPLQSQQWGLEKDKACRGAGLLPSHGRWGSSKRGRMAQPHGFPFFSGLCGVIKCLYVLFNPRLVT